MKPIVHRRDQFGNAQVKVTMLNKILSSLKTLFPKGLRGQPKQFSSSDYWEKRYVHGDNSGAGSYDRLADFKAEILSDFLRKNDVQSVVELGCGDGNQLSKTEYPKYLGVDVSPAILEQVKIKFSDRKNYKFSLMKDLPREEKFDLSLSLDVIYHLVEDEVFESYMSDLFDLSSRFVIIYSSNMGVEWHSTHVRHRRFSDWIDKNRRNFDLLDFIPNKYPYSMDDIHNTSFADFFIYKKTDVG